MLGRISEIANKGCVAEIDGELGCCPFRPCGTVPFVGISVSAIRIGAIQITDFDNSQTHRFIEERTLGFFTSIERVKNR